jgi:alkanesulfonate monooxygenase SsuD/methylene tetrahydromethanopterin reductase-like flavin-dependent oxidoreductase (luciferase family)
MLADLAYEAEEAGWDGFFLWDQVSKSTLTPTVDPMVDPWVALATIALGTPLPRRRPWKVMRETMSLDHLSSVRLIFGVSSGGGYFDFEALGEASDAKMLAALLDEGLEVLTELWRGEPYRHEGSAYQIKEAQFLPRPLQSPRIPIWVVGMWPAKEPLHRAASFDAVIPIGRDLPLTAMLTPAQMQEIVRFVASRIHHPVRGRPFWSHRRYGRCPRPLGRCRLPAGGSHLVGGKDPARTLGKLDRLAP